MTSFWLILFTVVPAVELFVLIKVGGVIGAADTIFIIILTGILGAALTRHQGFKILDRIRQAMERGQMPAAELVEGALILVGGVLLLTPGFITDAAGFFLLVPLTRRLIRQRLTAWIGRQIEAGRAVHLNVRQTGSASEPDDYDDDIIDV
jgi:UPF0716 protein FxsA